MYSFYLSIYLSLFFSISISLCSLFLSLSSFLSLSLFLGLSLSIPSLVSLLCLSIYLSNYLPSSLHLFPRSSLPPSLSPSHPLSSLITHLPASQNFVIVIIMWLTTSLYLASCRISHWDSPRSLTFPHWFTLRRLRWLNIHVTLASNKNFRNANRN